MADLFESHFNDTGSSLRFYKTQTRFGQTFKAISAHTVTSIDLYLMRTGVPPNPIYLALHNADGNGHPTGAALATGEIPVVDVSPVWDWAWAKATLSPEVTLVSGNTYVFVFYTTGGAVVSKDYVLNFDNNDTYADGKGITSTDSGGTWSDMNNSGTPDDIQFRVYGNEPAAPTAAFSGTPLSGTKPLTVQFTDESTDDPTSWLWDFGDEGSSVDQSPEHIYEEVGTYTVTLTATNDIGSDDEEKVDYITVFGPPSPYSYLNKDAYSGYHCFIEQYQKRKINDLTPFKLPDGTLY